MADGALEPLDTLEEQRIFDEQQRTGIGATDTPKILGLSKYGTALSVYERLVSTRSQGDPKPRESVRGLPAWMGLRLQSTVGELYTQATGYRIRAARLHYRHPVQDYVVCHLDFKVWGQPNVLVEAKTRAYMKGWGDDGTAEIPDDVWAQVQHEMAVVGATEAHVAVLFGHHTFRVYRILRDDTFIEGLLAALAVFWEKHVLASVPPPITGSPVDTKMLAARFPQNDAMYRAATATQEYLVRDLRAALAAEKTASEGAALMKNRVIEAIGPALGLQGAFGTVTYKKTSDVHSVKWAIVADVYRKMIDQILGWGSDPEQDDKEHEQLLNTLPLVESLYTEVREGTRRFTTQFTEEEV